MKRIRSDVKNGRIRFKCPSCSHLRYFSAPYGLRTKRVVCDKCNEKFLCALNRRNVMRKNQSGRVILKADGGNRRRDLNADLTNISKAGVGLMIIGGSTTGIIVGQEIQLKCQWGKNILGSGQYIVKNVSYNYVGAQSVGQGPTISV